MTEITRRNFIKGTLATTLATPVLGSIKADTETSEVEVQPESENLEERGKPLSEQSMLYRCFMDVQRINYERGWISKEKYDKIRKGKVVTQKVGRRTYLIPA